MNEVYAIAAMAERDLMKFLRDRARLISTFVLPFLLIGVLGGSLQMNLGRSVGFNFVGFTFTGVLGMTIFQSTASGMAWLAEDRFNDFAQEIFVSPVSRYSIVFGKILGESLVALAQVAPLIVFALILRVSLTAEQVVLMVPVAVISCLLGGSFGLVAMTMINDQRAANQIFQFLILPQFFLAGVFNPIGILPWYLEILSRISPMRYVVDLIRGVVYAGHPEYHQVVLLSPVTNVLVVAAMFGVFMVVGTALFVRHETKR
ncbi:MAG TPA: ABC transporter permease [Candidatus Dormibacteraeota bacterium]|nr:ABC transporter permease [Candidatus Dormibacteraeota bacterium]